MNWSEALQYLFSINNTNAYNFSKKVGVSNKTVSNIINGITLKPQPDTKSKIETEFNVKINDADLHNVKIFRESPRMFDHNIVQFTRGVIMETNSVAKFDVESTEYRYAYQVTNSCFSIELGDLVLFDTQEIIMDNDYAIVSIENEVSIFRYRKINNHLIQLSTSANDVRVVENNKINFIYKAISAYKKL